MFLWFIRTHDWVVQRIIWWAQVKEESESRHARDVWFINSITSYFIVVEKMKCCSQRIRVASCFTFTVQYSLCNTIQNLSFVCIFIKARFMLSNHDTCYQSMFHVIYKILNHNHNMHSFQHWKRHQNAICHIDNESV